MLTLTRKTEYAVIAACHLAREGGRTVSAREIAACHGVSLPLLMNVMKSMHQCGVLRSVRGSRGGYTLARDAHEISLADLIQSVEGRVRLVRCAGASEAGEPCDLQHTCPVRRPLLRVHESFEKFLTALTIAGIAFDEAYGAAVGSVLLKVMN